MKQLITLLTLFVSINVSSAQTWYKNNALDTASDLVNSGYTAIKTLNVSYAGSVSVYLKFYDTNTKVYNSSTAKPVLTLQLSNTRPTTLYNFDTKMTFKNGLYIKCTTGAYDTSLLVPVSKPIVNIQY